MMKNILFVYICLFGLALPLSAQKLDAQDILDRTATAFRQAGGIQADFTVQTYAKGVLQGSSVGTIRLKGEKFLLDADGVKTWFDGRTQWSYLFVLHLIKRENHTTIIFSLLTRRHIRLLK